LTIGTSVDAAEGPAVGIVLATSLGEDNGIEDGFSLGAVDG
jgi:hypothetical protein